METRPMIQILLTSFVPFSDYSGGQTKLEKILLNGNNICMVSGEKPATRRQGDSHALDQRCLILLRCVTD